MPFKVQCDYNITRCQFTDQLWHIVQTGSSKKKFTNPITCAFIILLDMLKPVLSVITVCSYMCTCMLECICQFVCGNFTGNLLVVIMSQVIYHLLITLNGIHLADHAQSAIVSLVLKEEISRSLCLFCKFYYNTVQNHSSAQHLHGSTADV